MKKKDNHLSDVGSNPRITKSSTLLKLGLGNKTDNKIFCKTVVVVAAAIKFLNC